jgi:membrane protein implicated in regulation of membrane protease activity
MNWWAWVIGGGILLGSELTFVNAQFYLVFIGAAAVLAGAVTWALPGLPPWGSWAIFALAAVGSMLAFRSRVYEWLHRHAPGVHSGVALGDLTLPDALGPGDSCRAEHGGSSWTVRNDSQTVLPAGSRVRIAAVNGLTLLVRP